ncbi:MAG TPA: hypothetical protein VFB60_20005 [Ktedonobacteraceae bacterium]|nr:hypothetical protein [Ktedonobacteraceae bacterium]
MENMKSPGDMKANQEGYFTYQQAATELNRSVESIQKAVSAGILHPVRFPPSNTRYLRREEVEWFKDKPLSIAIAKAYQQLQEAREEVAKLKSRMQEEASGALGLLLVLAVVGVGLGLLAASQKTRDDLEHDEFVHGTFIKSLKDLETREDYPTMAKELGNTLFDLARKEELTPSERQLINGLWKVLTMPSDDLSKIVSEPSV